ncbi:MAG: tyrosine-protein kinase Etk/Wzc [Candidatus Paceibacteria bacterium]|jgi:tyrosine-protein kinase Etk/Wzc
MNYESNQSGGRDEFISIGEFIAFGQRWRGTILLTALVVVSLSITYTLTRTPVYKAAAILRLEQEGKGNGPLADLAALTSAPAAESEIALLRSRSLAEEVLQGSPGWDQPLESFGGDARIELEPAFRDMTVAIQPEDLSPYASLLRTFGAGKTGTHRLYVAFPAKDGHEVDELRVRFLDEERVRISRPGWMGFGEKDALDYEYVPGSVLTYAGESIRLQATGRFAGQSYRVQRRSVRTTIEELMEHTSVRETARNSGVLELTVEGGSPDIVAEQANALAEGYFLRSMYLGGQRADRTLGFVDTELERVLEQLSLAEQEVVSLAREHARAINVSATSQAMINALAEYEGEKTQIMLSRRALTEARRQIDEGDIRGLALLGPALSDPLTVSHIQAIGELRALAAGIGRSDGSAYKLLLERDLTNLRLEREILVTDTAALKQSVEAVVSGDMGQLTRLASGSIAEDTIAIRYLEEIATLESELAHFGELVTAKHLDRVSRVAARAALVSRLTEHSETRLSAAENRLEAQAESIRAHEEAIASWASDERGRIDTAAESLIALVRDNLTSQLTGLGIRETSLQRAIADIEGELAKLPEHERQLAEPIRRREAFNGIAKILLESQQQAQLAKAGTLPSAILIDSAAPPMRRSSPKVFTNISVALLLGLILGVAMAWLRNALLDSLHTQAAIEEAIDLTVIGSVPDFRNGKLRARCSGADFLPVRDDQHGAVAESYRSIRESLRFSMESGERIRTFAATSCVANEGKTLTNLNMALAFAGGGRRVLLVDADMRSPSVAQYFNAQNAPGFAEALEGREEWGASVVPSGVEGMDLLLAGHPHGSSNDLLRTERAISLLEEFKENYDHVVFDLPPAMLVSDVETFADKFDSVALVYRSGGVSRGMLIQTVQRLRRSRVKLSGVVMNFVQSTGADHYGNGYGEGYGSDRMDELSRRTG